MLFGRGSSNKSGSTNHRRGGHQKLLDDDDEESVGAVVHAGEAQDTRGNQRASSGGRFLWASPRKNNKNKNNKHTDHDDDIDDDATAKLGNLAEDSSLTLSNSKPPFVFEDETVGSNDQLVPPLTSTSTAMLAFDIADNTTVNDEKRQDDELVLSSSSSQQQQQQYEGGDLALLVTPPAFMSDYLPEEATAMAIFDNLDVDGNEILSFGELGKIWKQLFKGLPRKLSVMKAYKIADANQDGMVQRDEFEPFLRVSVYYSNCYDGFALSKKKHAKRLTKNEFAQVAPTFGIHDADTVFDLMDENQSGKVTYEEFCRWMAHNTRTWSRKETVAATVPTFTVKRSSAVPPSPDKNPVMISTKGWKMPSNATAAAVVSIASKNSKDDDNDVIVAERDATASTSPATTGVTATTGDGMGGGSGIASSLGDDVIVAERDASASTSSATTGVTATAGDGMGGGSGIASSPGAAATGAGMAVVGVGAAVFVSGNDSNQGDDVNHNESSKLMVDTNMDDGGSGPNVLVYQGSGEAFEVERGLTPTAASATTATGAPSPPIAAASPTSTSSTSVRRRLVTPPPFISKHLPEEDVAVKMYDEADVNGNGTLSFAELGTIWRTLLGNDGLLDHKLSIMNAYTIADANQDGMVQRKELEPFLRVSVYYSNCYDVFAVAGQGHVKSMTKEEFAQVAPTFGIHEAHTVFDWMDENRSGKVSYEEFCRWMAHNTCEWSATKPVDVDLLTPPTRTLSKRWSERHMTKQVDDDDEEEEPLTFVDVASTTTTTTALESEKAVPVTPEKPTEGYDHVAATVASASGTTLVSTTDSGIELEVDPTHDADVVAAEDTMGSVERVAKSPSVGEGAGGIAVAAAAAGGAATVIGAAALVSNGDDDNNGDDTNSDELKKDLPGTGDDTPDGASISPYIKSTLVNVQKKDELMSAVTAIISGAGALLNEDDHDGKESDDLRGDEGTGDDSESNKVFQEREEEEQGDDNSRLNDEESGNVLSEDQTLLEVESEVTQKPSNNMEHEVGEDGVDEMDRALDHALADDVVGITGEGFKKEESLPTAKTESAVDSVVAAIAAADLALNVLMTVGEDTTTKEEQESAASTISPEGKMNGNNATATKLTKSNRGSYRSSSKIVAPKSSGRASVSPKSSQLKTPVTKSPIGRMSGGIPTPSQRRLASKASKENDDSNQETPSTKPPTSSARKSVSTSKRNLRTPSSAIRTPSSRARASSIGSSGSRLSLSSPPSGYPGTCINKTFQPLLYTTYKGCERCLQKCSDEEREFFYREGHNPRVQLCRGGCSPDCTIFPRDPNNADMEAAPRLCVQCFHATHDNRRKSSMSNIRQQ